MKGLIKGEDYYFDERGFFVFTSNYHASRGYCCGYECRECPFQYEAVAEPRRSQLLATRNPPENKGETDRDLG